MVSLDTLTRMVRGMFLRGMTLASDASGVMQRITVRLRDGEERGPLEHWEPQGLTSRPAAGGRVLAARVGGREDDPVIICANDPSYRPTGLTPGSTVVYDLAGHKVTLDVSGGISIATGLATVNVTPLGAVSITAATSVTVTGASASIDCAAVRLGTAGPGGIAGYGPVALIHPTTGLPVASPSVTASCPAP